MNPVSISYNGEISIIKISNPPVNAISLEVRNGLLNAVNELEKKEEVKAVIICAPDRTFLAGADIREFGKNLGGPTFSEICIILEKLKKYIQNRKTIIVYDQKLVKHLKKLEHSISNIASELEFIRVFGGEKTKSLDKFSSLSEEIINVWIENLF